MATPDQDDLREALKSTAVALKRAEVPFALGGGYAAWARGAPEPDHDADFVVAAADADRAADAVAAAGLAVQRPPEDWLFKVRLTPDDEAFVDVLWRLCDTPVDAEVLGRSDSLPVLSVQMPVMRATEVVAGKLAPLTDHYCDFARLLPVARALREQVDWADVRRRVAGNDYAAAFLFLVDRLGISGG
jgi:hypothetical protein